MAGGAGGDRVLGFGGNVRIGGGEGRDLLGGGRGADRLAAHDARRDVVHCGGGADRARLDRDDIVRSCETRRYGEYVEPDVPLPPWAKPPAGLGSVPSS